MSQKFIIQLSKTIKKEVIEIYEIEAEDKYQAILDMHKKTDEEKEQFLRRIWRRWRCFDWYINFWGEQRKWT